MLARGTKWERECEENKDAQKATTSDAERATKLAAAVMAGVLMLGAATPDEALAARSGGVCGSSVCEG